MAAEEAYKEALARHLATTRQLTNQWIPHNPTEQQRRFLELDCREAFYGGAAGGGKSEALLMAALQYVDTTRYAALILRRNYVDLSLPGALMERAYSWLAGKPGAHWNSNTKTWHFTHSDATLTFGYLSSAQDMYRYQSAEFQYIAIDELTQFPENIYRFLFSRLRRLRTMSTIPVRMRAASNPGNIGHDWVKRRFITNDAGADRIFIPAKLSDNPYLDQVEYIRNLQELDPIMLQQLLYGDWDTAISGAFFRRTWFQIIDPQDVPDGVLWVRAWDRAATEVTGPSSDPDYTAGVKEGHKAGIFYIAHVDRFRGEPAANEQRIAHVASVDGPKTIIGIEQEPGSAGKDTIYHYAKDVLAGYTVFGIPARESKTERALPLASAARNGLVKIVRGPWNSDFLDELEAFPYGRHKDQVDAAAHAHAKLLVLRKGWALGPSG